MSEFSVYLPIVGLLLAIIAMLFATATDRNQQWHDMCSRFARTFAGRPAPARPKPRFTVPRILLSLVVLHLLFYVWAYQRVQNAVAFELAKAGVEEVEIGSLIIPYSAFFQSNYLANVGFSKSKKRTRADVAVSGHLWGGWVAEIDESGLADINRIIGKKFVFSYLTDVKILRPAIDRHMTQLLRAQQIDKYEIETFDNRGPYILVALNAKNNNQDANTIATSLAQGLYINLTQIKQLKVNQVVIKVVERQAYIDQQGITVIGRGRAGNY